MKQLDLKYFKYLYNPLEVGILVLGQDFQCKYYNPSYKNILQLGTYEFDSFEGAHEEFTQAVQKNRNKKGGTIRFLQEKMSIQAHVDITSLKVSNEKLLLITLYLEDPQSRQFKNQERVSYIWGHLRLNLDTQIAKFKRRIIPFSETEFKLFTYLCQNEDRLISKDELLKNVWKIRALNTRTVDIYISRLRKKMVDCGCKYDYIKTVHGRGYIFDIGN